MKTLSILQLCACLAWASEFLIDKDVYLKQIAPGTVARITKYQNDNELNAQQAAFLDHAKNVATDYKVDELDGIKAQCNDLFKADECLFVLTGMKPGPVSIREAPRMPLLVREPSTCECTQAHSWCSDGTCCQYKNNDCIFHGKLQSCKE